MNDHSNPEGKLTFGQKAKAIMKKYKWEFIFSLCVTFVLFEQLTQGIGFLLLFFLGQFIPIIHNLAQSLNFGYMLYAWCFLDCLLQMLMNVGFSYLFVRKQAVKIAALVFCTQGLAVELSYSIYDIIYSINNYHLESFQDIVSLENVRFDMVESLMLTVLILAVGFFTYRSIDKKMNWRKWIALLGGFLINIATTVYMMFEFGIIVNVF